jgi:hypothetical protein
VPERVRHGVFLRPDPLTADTVALYRFHHDTWTGAWWRACAGSTCEAGRWAEPPRPRTALRAAETVLQGFAGCTTPLRSPRP